MWRINKGSVVARAQERTGVIPLDKLGRLTPSKYKNVKMANRLLNECLLKQAYPKFSLPLAYVSQISTFFPLIACYREGLYESMVQLAPDDESGRGRALWALIKHIREVSDLFDVNTNFSGENITSINNTCNEAYRHMSSIVERLIEEKHGRSGLDFLFRLTRPSFTLEEMLLRRDLLDVESYYELEYSIAYTYYYKAILNKEGSEHELQELDTFSVDHPEVAALGLLTNLYVMERLLGMPEFTADELRTTITRANLLQKPHFGDYNVHQLRKVSFVMPEGVETLGFTVKGGQLYSHHHKETARKFHFSPVYVAEVEPGSFADENKLFAKGDKIVAVNNTSCLDLGMPVTKRFIRNSLNLSMRNQRYVTFTVMHDPERFIRDFYRDNLFHDFFSKMGNNQLKFSPKFRQPKLHQKARSSRFYVKLDR